MRTCSSSKSLVSCAMAPLSSLPDSTSPTFPL